LISKSNDSWACLYTTIVRGLDYSDLALEVRLNGEVVTSGRTRHMTTSVAALISYLSQYVTLTPGDVIYTGTIAPPILPGARHAMRDGDVVEVTIENIGTLRNRVVAVTGGTYLPVGALEETTRP
jgi:2-keto-4-pentenoate hydratase/2-oxohepta-3-ene-1,7-dioic acid hydratase in catechol pathway